MRAYRGDVDAQGMDISPQLRVNGLLLRKRADGYVDDETPALQIQSDRSRERRVGRARQHDHFRPGPVGGPLRAAFLPVCSAAPPYDERACANEGDDDSDDGSVPRYPVLSLREIAARDDGKRSSHRSGRRLDGVGNPGRGL